MHWQIISSKSAAKIGGVWLGVAVLALGAASARADATLPEDSAMARAQSTLQRVLLSGCEEGDRVLKHSWLIDGLAVSAAEQAIAPKFGQTALRFSGQAKVTGAKGDFLVVGGYARPCRMLGIWVYVAPEANVGEVGLQLVDGEGEYLSKRVPAKWSGWKWVEVDLTQPGLTQAYPQEGKNGRFDQPLKDVCIVWHAKGPGQSWVVVDGLMGASEPDASAGAGLRMDLLGGGALEPGRPLSAGVVLTNFSAQPVSTTVTLSVQQNPSLAGGVLPDPVYGSDHGVGAKSWTECDGKQVEEGSLTDDNEFTSASTPWQAGHYGEAFQVVDLGRERRITHLRYTSGDANWYWKVDFSASADGRSYSAVPGLQGLDWHQKWGRQEQVVPQPFVARYLRLRYHNDGKKSDVIRMPATLSIYDGVDDEPTTLPAVGPVVASGGRQVEIPARSFVTVRLSGGKSLDPGSYLVAARLEQQGRAQLACGQAFVMPPEMGQRAAESRFGINAADIDLAALNRRMGVGWVRFENLKWPMVSPAPGTYAYDGSVGPWNVPMDELIARYRALGLEFLPTMYQTPQYLLPANAPADGGGLLYPPKDLSRYGEFTFQTAARYAGAKHSADALKTSDKKSGLGQVKVYELWNEPDLTDPGWGSWRTGTLEQYLEMFRYGAEGVKRADPAALVANGGFADWQLPIVDKLRTYKYADGKCPLDFMDVLSVHHYSGQQAPELARRDPNVDRSGDAKNANTFEEKLKALAAWRDKYKPGMRIWLTETGYESAGPQGISERLGAAYLPRNVMLALAYCMDKVFVYREHGSTPSIWAASGMVRDDGSLKPAWFTYATVIRQLDGATSGERLLHADPNVRIFKWRCGPKTVVAAWAVEGEAKIDLQLGPCTVTDAFGRSEQTDLRGALPLSIFPVYISGIADAAVEKLAEASRRQEQEERNQASSQAAKAQKLKACLFEFGARQQVDEYDLGGSKRRFTPVRAQDIWGAGKNCGFEPAALSNDTFPWITDSLEREGVRLGPDIRFRFKAEPGRYRLHLRADPAGQTGRLQLKGVVGGPKALSLQQGGSPVEIDVEVSTEPLVIETDGFVILKWLALVEAM